MKIKVCGMRDSRNIREVEALGIDWMGFVFHPLSPRYCGNRPDYLPEGVRRVGVFVDAPQEILLERVAEFGLQSVQLHGHESPQECLCLRELGLEVFKAVGVGSPTEVHQAAAYQGVCDALLFDTRCATHGGSGRPFDWQLLRSYRGETPFLLSGGIGPESVESLRRFEHPRWMGIDLNSGFETAPGRKDAGRIGRFLQQLTDI